MGSEREAAARNTELRQKSQTRDQQTFSIKKQKESILGFMSQVIPRAIIQFFHCSIKAAADSTGRGSACILERLYNMWGNTLAVPALDLYVASHRSMHTGAR